jgi:hypothetical protein
LLTLWGGGDPLPICDLCRDSKFEMLDAALTDAILRTIRFQDLHSMRSSHNPPRR